MFWWQTWFPEAIFVSRTNLAACCEAGLCLCFKLGWMGLISSEVGLMSSELGWMGLMSNEWGLASSLLGLVNSEMRWMSNEFGCMSSELGLVSSELGL